MALKYSKGAFVQRVLLILGIIIFVAFFRWAYINWLSPTFDYYGFEYYAPPSKYLALAWICSVLPSLWMPMEITRPSHLAYWVLYLTVVIPSMFIPMFVRLSEPPDAARLTVALFLGFAISGLGYLLPLHPLRPVPNRKSVFWYGFSLLALVCAGSAIIGFGGNIHLVSFSEIYDVRDAARDLNSGPLLNYSLMWLYGAINPFLIAWGLFYRKARFFVVGALGQILVYSSFGTKASLLSIVFILGLYLLFRIGKGPFALKMTWGIVALFAVLCWFYTSSGGESGIVLFMMLFLVFFRSFGLAGLLTGQYFYFFQHNPLTYYSHLKGISWFIQYPFKYPLGTEVGYYYYNPLVDTTAHFWATDGIAALGLPGILLVSAVGAFVFWLIDSVTQRHDPRFAGLAIFYATYSLANLSMFTTLLSGGLALSMLLLYLAPPQQGPGFAASSNRIRTRVAGSIPAS